MYQIKIGDNSYEVIPNKGQSSSGKIDAADYALNVSGDGDDLHIIHNDQSFRVTVVSANYESKSFNLRVNSNDYSLQAKDRFDLLLEELGMEDLAASAVNDLKAPMPGLVIDIHVKPGDTVKKGDPVVVLEAMKMENILKAESDATVKAVNTEPSKAVEKNEVLIEFEA